MKKVKINKNPTTNSFNSADRSRSFNGFVFATCECWYVYSFVFFFPALSFNPIYKLRNLGKKERTNLRKRKQQKTEMRNSKN